MPSDSARLAGPAPDDFAGASVAQTCKRLFHATRPKFFPASVLPVLAGSAWGYSIAGQFDTLVFALALFATMCVHAGSNVINDVGDDAGGTDRQNYDRIYPYTGGSQFIQSGIMPASSMARWGISLLALAAVAGIVLLILKGQMILWFGLAGVLLAVLYSLGPVRLSSIGIGELAVGIAFGVIPIVGAAWLQTGLIDTNVVIFSLPISAWVAAILLINEVPDLTADAATGKRTLPVRMGLSGTAALYAGIHVFATVIVVWLTVRGGLPIAAPALPLLLLIIAWRATGAIRQGVADRDRMTKGIEATLGIHTLGSLWLAGCALFVAFWGA